MKRLVLIALILAGACATPRHASGDSAWLTGVWLPLETEADRDLAACASGLPIRYGADGSYDLFEEAGVWRLESDRLTETATRAHDTVDPSEVAIGQPFVSRIRRIDTDSFEKIYADGESLFFRRCPKLP